MLFLIPEPPAMQSSRPISGLVLASGSPRRREAFERLFGKDRFTVIPSELDESQIPFHRNADTYVQQVSREKCQAFLQTYPEQDYFVVAADTIVVSDGLILGKPADKAEARVMLRQLSGKRHRVMTAVSMAFGRNGRIVTEVETTLVWFSELSDATIDWYVSTGEPMDKAGAYGIQELGVVLVSRIQGCYTNIVGLPVRRMITMMECMKQDPGSHFLISDYLPWSQAGLSGGENGTQDQPHQGPAQNIAAL